MGTTRKTDFIEFISNKATLEHQQDKLGEHIAFYSNKKYFFAAGKGLKRCQIISSLQTSHPPGPKVNHTRPSLQQKIFTFIQHSRAGGCKIICQYDGPTIILSKGRTETLNVREWFTTNVTGINTNPAEQLDWNTKKFEPRWSFKLETNNKPEPTDSTGETWTSNWHIQKDDQFQALQQWGKH
jgi:hypothetical protein